MSVASRGGNAVSALLRNSSRVCSQCSRSRPHRAIIPFFPAARRHFAEAAAPSPSELPPSSSPDDASAPPSAPRVFPRTPPSHYHLKAGLILSRPPLLTRTPTPFESAFYLYQKRLDERLAVPFQKSFYFRKDTASDLDWRIKIRERHGVAAKDIGRYNPRGRVAWNDEVLVGSRTSEPEHIVEKLLEDAEMRVSDDGEAITEEERVKVERPMPRRTEADEKGDVKRLDRALDQTLYFVVKRENGEWGFPMGNVPTDEALHETAKRVLEESAGVNMNTWIVGRVPVAHYIKKPLLAEGESPETAPEKKGEKVFFLKGRIMAGQADLTGNCHGLTDFKWVTKDELAQTLPHETWRAVKNMVDLR